MASEKTLTVKLSHVFTSGRGESESVAEALAWLEDEREVDEETGEPTEDGGMEPGDLIVYAVRRLRALSKDGKRYASGKLPRRIYNTRLDNLTEKAKEKVPAALERSVKLADQADAELNPEPVKKESKPAAKKESKAPAAKAAPTPTAAPVKASAPKVRKAKTAPVVDAGGAAVTF